MKVKQHTYLQIVQLTLDTPTHNIQHIQNQMFKTCYLLMLTSALLVKFKGKLHVDHLLIHLISIFVTFL
jgi:hypothetical protein